MNRLPRQKNNKRELEQFLRPSVPDRYVQNTTGEHTFFSSIQKKKKFSRLDYIFDHKTSPNKFKEIDTIPNILYNYSGGKLEINGKMKTKSTNV